MPEASMRYLLQDLRYALRMLRKNPGFTVVAVLTLALGIGANTGIFTVVNTVLLRPLAYPEPDRIVQFMVSPRAESKRYNMISAPLFTLWHEQTDAFQDFALYEEKGPTINLTGGDRPEPLKATHVSAGYFRMFGAPLEIGRTFTQQEDVPGGPRLVLISDGLWRRRFGGDRSLVGKAIILGGDPHVVIGVLSASFVSDPPGEIWLPAQVDPNSNNFAFRYRGAARLKPGATLRAANAQMVRVAQEFRRKFPGSSGPEGPVVTVEQLRDAVVRDIRRTLVLLLGAVGFVLLIACANVANLLLARASARKRELAIRAALGADRRRIISQLLTESILLCFAGAALGLGLGYAGLRALLFLNPGNVPRIGAHGSNVSLDWRVLGFTLLISVLTAVFLALLPAFSALREDVNTALTESGARSGSSLRQSFVRSALVVSEMALALVLLAGATLLVRTFTALRAVDPGFDSHNVLTLEMSLAAEPRLANTAAAAQLVREAGRRVESIPGVVALATTISIPLDGSPLLGFTIEGRPFNGDQQEELTGYRQVSWRYFEVFRIPLLRGRMFTDGDDSKAAPVVLINNTMARQFWPASDPLGERITIGKGAGPVFDDPPRQIIGVVADVRDSELKQSPIPTVYVPGPQITDALTALGNSTFPLAWVVRTKTDPYSLSADIQRELRIASGGLPVAHIRPMEQIVGESTAQSSFNTLLLAMFAGVATLLAAIGIYGVMSYTVGQRAREIGIRMALGARAGDVLSLVLRRGLSLALFGIAIGLAGAMGLTSAMKSLLFGVSPSDPSTFATVGALLFGVAAMATYIPARRATRVDPIIALRYE
jgi:putative ABC transport system permease protein